MIKLKKLTSSTAHIVQDGKVIGHIGSMAGGSQQFVNASTLGPQFVFASHAPSVEEGFNDLIKRLNKEQG